MPGALLVEGYQCPVLTNSFQSFLVSIYASLVQVVVVIASKAATCSTRTLQFFGSPLRRFTRLQGSQLDPRQCFRYFSATKAQVNENKESIIILYSFRFLYSSTRIL